MSFRVPELSRVREGRMGSDESYGCNGYFVVHSPRPGWDLHVIASDGLGWEHVSVRAVTERGQNRTPAWDEMCFVKDLFWDAEDVALQFHPRRSQYVNNHKNVLHMWRPVHSIVHEPPPELVGIRGVEVSA